MLDIKGRLAEAEKQKEIARENAILLTKLNNIIEKPNVVIQTPIVKPKTQKVLTLNKKEPNIKQNSEYSTVKLQYQWKEQLQHSKIASKVPKSTQNKQINQQLSTMIPSPNKDTFEGMLRFFDQLRLQQTPHNLFKQPQSLAQRVIFIRKTIMIQEIPHLIEISGAYNKVFFIAHNMSVISSPVIRLIMSLQKAKSIFHQYDYDFQVIVNKISIQGSKISIKIPLKQQTIDSQFDVFNEKKAFEKQTKFIKRNYYNFMQKMKQQINQSKNRDSEPISDLRKRFHSITSEDHLKFHPSSTVSNRYRNQIDQNQNLRMKRFSIAVKIKKNKVDSQCYTNNKLNQSKGISNIKNKSLSKKPSYFQQFFNKQNIVMEKTNDDNRQSYKKVDNQMSNKILWQRQSLTQSKNKQNSYNDDFEKESYSIEFVKPHKKITNQQQSDSQLVEQHKIQQIMDQEIQEYIEDFQQ